MRTYLYKLTSDRGGAPCAPPPKPGQEALLTLSICKPAIRRTAQPGDRILGITSRSLEQSDGYPLNAVIYAAKVTGAVDAREYYAFRGPFRHRPDCIYAFHQANGKLSHTGRTRLHSDPEYEARDIGRYPFYRNGRSLLAKDFRYFGSKVIEIPEDLTRLRHICETLGQGHRVFDERAAESSELNELFTQLWKRRTRYTPTIVEDEAYGHAPRSSSAGGLRECARQTGC